MKHAMINGKGIICQQPLNDDLIQQFIKLSKEFDVTFDYQYGDQFSQFDLKTTCNSVTVPVITVVGLGENCSKFETQLVLRRLLIDCGYKISLIGSRQGCKLLGIHDFPNFMFENKYSELDKINCFQRYICKLEEDEKPDAIIIGIPGGIMPLNDTIHMGYGIICYEVFNAIKPDFNVLNLWCKEFNDSFVQEMRNVMRYKFGTTLDCVCFSNTSIDYEYGDKEDLQCSILNKEIVDRRVSAIKLIPSYNTFNPQSCFSLREYLLSQLTN